MTPTSAATYTRDWIAGIASGTDSLAVLQRTSFRIPQTPDSAIAFVSDSAVCARAAVAHAVARGQSASNPADVVVLRIGATRYLVWNYSKIGEFLEYHVFDDNWRFLSRIAS